MGMFHRVLLLDDTHLYFVSVLVLHGFLERAVTRTRMLLASTLPPRSFPFANARLLHNAPSYRHIRWLRFPPQSDVGQRCDTHFMAASLPSKVPIRPAKVNVLDSLASGYIFPFYKVGDGGVFTIECGVDFTLGECERKGLEL